MSGHLHAFCPPPKPGITRVVGVVAQAWHWVALDTIGKPLVLSLCCNIIEDHLCLLLLHSTGLSLPVALGRPQLLCLVHVLQGGPVTTSAMFRHTTDINNVQSVLERNDLEELMAMVGGGGWTGAMMMVTVGL